MPDDWEQLGRASSAGRLVDLPNSAEINGAAQIRNYFKKYSWLVPFQGIDVQR